jgi:transcriptional/translational regulatory protein YebC/TACO1
LLAGESDDLLTDPEMAGQYDDGVNFDIPTVVSRIDEIKADKAKFDQQETNRLNQIAYSIGNAARAGGPPPQVDPEILKRRPYPGPGKW